MADIIGSCCTDGKIAGRTGGDEFYIFAPCCNDAQIEAFRREFLDKIAKFNARGEKPYLLDASFGSYLHEMTPDCDVEELIRIADENMYEAKQEKKRRAASGM